MSDSIRLHPKLGVNPHLTYCPRCGGEGRDIVLIGARDYIDRCCECDMHLIGGGRCPKHPGRRTERVRKIEEHEKLPGSMCEACEADQARQEAEVVAGGVYFRCGVEIQSCPSCCGAPTKAEP